MPKPPKYIRISRDLDYFLQEEELKIEYWRNLPRGVHLLVVIHAAAKVLKNAITQGQLLRETKDLLRKGDWCSPHSLEFNDATLRKYIRAYILYRLGRYDDEQRSIPPYIKRHLAALPSKIQGEVLAGLLALSKSHIKVGSSVKRLIKRLKNVQSVR